MSELLLLTSSRSITSAKIETPFEFEEVVGVIKDDRTQVKPVHRLDGSEQEVSTGISGDMAERIVESFVSTRGFDRNRSSDINCHLFVFFAMGRARALEGNAWIPLLTKSVSSQETEPGIPYATVTREGNISHSLLGTSLIGRSLSLLGNKGALSICSNEMLMNLYKGWLLGKTAID